MNTIPINPVVMEKVGVARIRCENASHRIYTFELRGADPQHTTEYYVVTDEADHRGPPTMSFFSSVLLWLSR